MNKQNPQQGQQIKINADNQKLQGDYSNMLQITHNKEEFWLDFFSVFPPTGNLVSRVIMNPGHIKRTIKAMQENLKKYEEKFGSVEEAKEPQKPSIGFGSQ